MKRSIVIASMLSVLVPFSMAMAGVSSRAIQETAEWVGRTFLKGAAQESIEKLSTKMTALAARHGDDLVMAAFRKVGPRASHLVAEAGEQADVALKLLAQHGDEAVSLLARKGTLSSVARYGDDAAKALIKHGSVADGLVERFGREAVKSLTKITPQNGRRLAMMSADGTLRSELLPVVSQWGDAAADFIWKHKGALAVGATLTAFVSDPEPFLHGTVSLADSIASSTIAPIASIPSAVATEAAKGINWNLVVCLAAAVMSFLVVLRYLDRRRSQGKEARHDG